MTTQQYKRPATSAPVAGEAGLPNRDKFQQVSATRPRIPIASLDIDSELNNLIDAVNELYDTAISGTVPDNSVTLAKLAHLTAGSMYYMDGTGAPSELTIGSAGEVLAVSGGVPTWQAVAGSPTAIISPYAGSAAPSGWLLCDGSAVSRTTYSDLFAAISTTYGVGDGSTTFNVPDLRGNIPLGLDNMGGTSANRVTSASADSLGGTLGSETDSATASTSGTVAGHALTANELPAADVHVLTSGLGSSGVASGIFSPTDLTQTDQTSSGATYTANWTGSEPAAQIDGGGASHTHGWSGTTTVTGTTGANVQPSLALNYIIKT